LCVPLIFQRKKKKKKKNPVLHSTLCRQKQTVACFALVFYGVGSTVVMIAWWFGPFGAVVMIFMVLRRNNLHQTL
jgi:hypothetical protein